MTSDVVIVAVSHVILWGWLQYRVASVENKASHPMASALVNFADLHGVKPAEHVTDFEVIVGEGVSANVNGRTIDIGNARMAHRLGRKKGAESFL
jgi:Cd2+/Zn2+-exporting ATPase